MGKRFAKYLRIKQAFLYDLNRAYGIESSWRNRLARSTVNREVVGSIPTEDDRFLLPVRFFLVQSFLGYFNQF